jgi:hypothetical protein
VTSIEDDCRNWGQERNGRCEGPTDKIQKIQSEVRSNVAVDSSKWGQEKSCACTVSNSRVQNVVKVPLAPTVDVRTQNANECSDVQKRSNSARRPTETSVATPNDRRRIPTVRMTRLLNVTVVKVETCVREIVAYPLVYTDGLSSVKRE